MIGSKPFCARGRILFRLTRIRAPVFLISISRAPRARGSVMARAALSRGAHRKFRDVFFKSLPSRGWARPAGRGTFLRALSRDEAGRREAPQMTRMLQKRAAKRLTSLHVELKFRAGPFLPVRRAARPLHVDRRPECHMPAAATEAAPARGGEDGAIASPRERETTAPSNSASRAPSQFRLFVLDRGLRSWGARQDHIPRGRTIPMGAVPVLARGLGHMVPTYLRRRPGSPSNGFLGSALI